MKKNTQLLYYNIMFISGIVGLIYYIFVPNLFLLSGAIIFTIIGVYNTRSTIAERQFEFGIIGHISFAFFLIFLASVYFIEFGTDDFNLILYGLVIIVGIILGIFISIKYNKESNKI